MANLLIQARRNRAPTRRPARPITAHVSWRLKMLYGLLPFAASTRGRSRQHHDESEQHEDDDDDGDHVVPDGRRPAVRLPQP